MTTNPTAAQIAQYTATVCKAGKKWVHQLIDENGEVIATRKTDAAEPYTAACVLVTTRNASIDTQKRDMKKYSAYKGYRKACQEIIDRLQAEINAGADANEYQGRAITWTRKTGSAGYGAFVARQVLCTAI